ncbi:MAG: phage holin family protein, partial [Propionibacterium sp.]|nr:phage holin family protein [Propionibacterium sp.]
GGMRFILRLLGNMLGIWVSTLVISEITFDQGATTQETLLLLTGIALVFTLVNSIVRPVMRVVAFPLYLLTFGLFALVTNALVFLATGWLAEALTLPFHAGGFWAALGGGTITAIISAIVVGVLGKAEKD